MATLDDLLDQRTSAGAAYAAAAAAYADAWAELHALDQFLANRAGVSLGFGQPFQIAGHSEFLRDVGPSAYGPSCDRAQALLQQHARDFTPEVSDAQD